MQFCRVVGQFSKGYVGCVQLASPRGDNFDRRIKCLVTVDPSRVFLWDPFIVAKDPGGPFYGIGIFITPYHILLWMRDNAYGIFVMPFMGTASG